MLRAGRNPAAPPAVLADLLNDRPPLESCEVCERHPVPWTHPPDCPDPDCELPGGAACDGSHQYARHTIVEAALGHPAVLAALLRELVTAEHNVATLRAVGGPTLTACLRDRRARERAAVHPALPLDRIRALLADLATAHLAAANPALPAADLLRLMPPQ
ncbi:hypothetical protein AB0O31_30160 [Kitasatospora cineracea]|uniref:hypothetical protein n=1 Tax=Kitasatospora cineracea TaxID=88074 RepID=UPI003430CC8B